MKKISMQYFAEDDTVKTANPNTNVTTSTASGNNMSPQMKTFYDKNIIRNAQPLLIHDQFGQKRPIPKNGGKKIEFRKLNPFPKALTPLTEGVTPDGRKLDWTKVEAEISQYGDYVTTSDILNLTAVDNTIVEAQRVLGEQAGATLDEITKEVLNSGTNVQYGEGTKTARNTLTADDKLTVLAVKKAVTTLKNMNAKRINGDYVAIIHPNVAFDLTEDPAWQAVNTYNPKNWYEGEIGKIYGVRFIETSEAKVFEKAGAVPASGSEGIDVYSTLIIGADAYGVTEVEGGGLETIVKPKGSGGTSDPLEQRSTIGWKATKTAEILTDAFMVRIETAASI